MRKNLEGKKKEGPKMKFRTKYSQRPRTPFRRMIKKKNIINFNRKQKSKKKNTTQNFRQSQRNKWIKEQLNIDKVKVKRIKNRAYKKKVIRGKDYKSINQFKKIENAHRKYIKNLEERVKQLQQSIYYNSKNYDSSAKYTQMIQIISSTETIPMQQREKIRVDNQNYIKDLQIILYSLGLKFLKNQNLRLSYIKPWIQFKKFFEELLTNKKLLLIIFKMQEGLRQKQMRQMFLESSLTNFKQYCQQAKKMKIGPVQHLSQLTIKRSKVYQDSEIYNQIQGMISIIRDSWYVSQLIAYYINNRIQNLLPKLNQNQRSKSMKATQWDYKTAKNFLKQVVIIFVDYAYTAVNGITLTRDNQKQYPIYINLFSLFEKNKKQIGFFLSYVFFVLMHQLAHSAFRKSNFFTQQESSNPNRDRSEKIDGGYLFQFLAFGNHITWFLSSDYDQIKKLLQVKNPPLDFQSLIENQEIFLQRIQKVQKQSKRRTGQIQRRNKQIQQNELYNINYQTKRRTNPGPDLTIIIQKQIQNLSNLLSTLKEYQHQQLKQQKQDAYQNKIQKGIKNIQTQQLQIQTIVELIKKMSLYGLRKQKEISQVQKETKYFKLKLGQNQRQLAPMKLNYCGTRFLNYFYAKQS